MTVRTTGSVLTVITVLLLHTLSSHHWCLQAFQGNTCHPRIIATQKLAAKKKVIAAVSGSKTYGSIAIFSGLNMQSIYMYTDTWRVLCS